MSLNQYKGLRQAVSATTKRYAHYYHQWWHQGGRDGAFSPNRRLFPHLKSEGKISHFRKIFGYSRQTHFARQVDAVTDYHAFHSVQCSSVHCP